MQHQPHTPTSPRAAAEASCTLDGHLVARLGKVIDVHTVGGREIRGALVQVGRDCLVIRGKRLVRDAKELPPQFSVIPLSAVVAVQDRGYCGGGVG